jgi:hypothetical protein
MTDKPDRRRWPEYRTPFRYSRAYQTVLCASALLGGLYATFTFTIQNVPGRTGWINRLMGAGSGDRVIAFALGLLEEATTMASKASQPRRDGAAGFFVASLTPTQGAPIAERLLSESTKAA